MRCLQHRTRLAVVERIHGNPLQCSVSVLVSIGTPKFIQLSYSQN
jgi:hypothetical protein